MGGLGTGRRGLLRPADYSARHAARRRSEYVGVTLRCCGSTEYFVAAGGEVYSADSVHIGQWDNKEERPTLFSPPPQLELRHGDRPHYEQYLADLARDDAMKLYLPLLGTGAQIVWRGDPGAATQPPHWPGRNPVPDHLLPNAVEDGGLHKTTVDYFLLYMFYGSECSPLNHEPDKPCAHDCSHDSCRRHKELEAQAAEMMEELLAEPEPTFDMYVRTARDQCLTLSFTHGEAAACDLEELRRRITERAGGAPVGGFRLLHDGVDVETRSLSSFLIPGARLEQRVRMHGGGGKQGAAERNKARKRAGGSLMGILGADWEKFTKMMAKRCAKNRALARSPKTPEDSIADSGTSDWTGMTEQGYGMFHKLTGPGKRAQPLASSNRQNENVPAATKPRTTAPSAAAAPRKKAPPRVNLPNCQKEFSCAVCFKTFGFKGDTNGPVDFFGKHVKRCCGGVGTNPKGHDEELMRAILPKGFLTNAEDKRQYGWCVCFNSGGECNGSAKLEGWVQDPNAQAAQPAAFQRAFDQLERNNQAKALAASTTKPSKKNPVQAPAPTAPEEPEVVGQQVATVERARAQLLAPTRTYLMMRRWTSC